MKTDLILTCGDPAGIGPEIIARWAEENAGLAERVTVAGPASWLERTPSLAAFRRLPVGSPAFAAIPGQPTEEGAATALAAMEEAAAGCQRGDYRAVVTGPVSKIWMQRAGFPHPGQTEFFEARWGGQAVMGFTGGGLRLALATWHIPLREVPSALDETKLERAVRAAGKLAALDGIDRPRVAVCGLNPHAGEEGLLGTEEVDWIEPALRRWRHDRPELRGPLPGDTVFWRARQGEFDAIVALYHDQGLAPLKAVAFDEAVHITLGLPHLRVSPDHGTAFSIAGKNQAAHRSLTQAVALALRAPQTG